MEFKSFSAINLARCKQWHDPYVWSLSDWATAVTGELGEACNIIKKLNRLNGGIQQLTNEGKSREEFIDMLAKEIADTFTYLDLLAQVAGIDLEKSIIDKFNEISRREKLPFFIEK